MARHSSNAILGYVEEALSERSADWSRNPALHTDLGDNSYMEDKALVERLDRVELALEDVKSENMKQDKFIASISEDVRSTTLASEEFKSISSLHWEATKEMVEKLSKQKVELRVISKDGHMKDGQARIHKVLANSTAWERSLWVTECGWHFGHSKACRLSLTDLPVSQMEGIPCSQCHPELAPPRKRAKAGRPEVGASDTSSSSTRISTP